MDKDKKHPDKDPNFNPPEDEEIPPTNYYRSSYNQRSYDNDYNSNSNSNGDRYQTSKEAKQ